MKQRNSGFSLVELLVVLAIMAVLTLAAIPNYQHFVTKAHFFEVVQVANQLRLMVEHCFQTHHRLSACRSGMGGIPKQIDLNDDGLVGQATVLANGVVRVLPKPRHGLSDSHDLVLTPSHQRHSLSWQYSGGAVLDGYVDV
ncbi:MAG: hypothetical protein CMF46_05695 [Legionellales bacterium]|nr:hypothetical protein [Legionellales bacterium]|tara:strand:+ start:253 stop:675 length:423 start_codon:yes stop_codon:yes gene_type:complete